MSRIENQVINKIKKRAIIGGKKYNTTMERTDFTINDWLNYLQEELIDAAIYAEKLLIEQNVIDIEQIIIQKKIPDVKVKIKDDAGIYKVCGIDWVHYKLLVDRSCGLEWVDFYKCNLKTNNEF